MQVHCKILDSLMMVAVMKIPMTMVVQREVGGKERCSFWIDTRNGY